MVDAKTKRFIRVGDKIYYSDSIDPIDLALETHADLADKVGVAEVDYNNKPVDDGGRIENAKGKFAFVNFTTTCKIKKDPTSERGKTYAIATSILGRDKVF